MDYYFTDKELTTLRDISLDFTFEILIRYLEQTYTKEDVKILIRREYEIYMSALAFYLKEEMITRFAKFMVSKEKET